MKIKINHILSAIALLLCALCCASVMAPLRFDRARAEREAAVKSRLMAIRQAQEAYRRANGTYAASFAQLIASRLITDTMQYVPYSGGERFELTATVHTGKTGNAIPLMECGAQYAEYLKGLDENRISQLTEKAYSLGRYPGLKVGDAEIPNDNAASWE